MGITKSIKEAVRKATNNVVDTTQEITSTTKSPNIFIEKQIIECLFSQESKAATNMFILDLIDEIYGKSGFRR